MANSIRADAAFNEEVIPPQLEKLIRDLCTFFKIPASNIGCKGNPAHRRGYHRSRKFILYSPFSRNKSYSVSGPGDREGGHDDWLAAIDISLPGPQLIPLCQRLDRAVRAGKLEKVAEWYGNLGGDNKVDGYDNIRNAIASSDTTHLWHCHISILRSRANDNHDDLFRILTGQAQEQDDDMDPMTAVPVPKNKPFPGYLGQRQAIPAGELWHSIYYRVTTTEKAIKDLAWEVSRLSDVISKLSGNTGGTAKK